MDVSKQHIYFRWQFRSIIAGILQQQKINGIFLVIHVLEHIHKGTLHTASIQVTIDKKDSLFKSHVYYSSIIYSNCLTTALGENSVTGLHFLPSTISVSI